MAQIQFKKDQPIQALSGTFGNITFKTVNGRTFGRSRVTPGLPKNASDEERATYKKRTIINTCISILQGEIADLQEAITMRPKIKKRVDYLYQKYVAQIKASSKLQKAIMTEYHSRFDTEKSTTKHRDSYDEVGEKKGAL